MGGRRATDRQSSGYLATMHTRSDAHKKRFAFGVSGIVTLSIFFVWFLIKNHEGTTAIAPATQGDVVYLGGPTETNTEPSITPFKNLGGGVAASWAAIRQGFSDASDAVDDLKVDSESR